MFVVILSLNVVSANDNINDVIIEDNSTFFEDDYQEDFDSYVGDYYENEEWSDDWMTTLEADNNTLIEKTQPVSEDFQSITSKDSSLTPMRVESDRNNCVYFSVDQISVAANSTANYITVNKSLPAVVDIDGHDVDMNDFLYLLCKSLNSSGNVEYVHFNHVSSSCGTNKAKSYLSRDNYTSIAASIVDCYVINNRNPKNINFRNITLNFDDTVKLFNQDQYINVFFYTSNHAYSYALDDLSGYVYVNANSYLVSLCDNVTMYEPGVTIHRTCDFLEIKFHGQMYGETNVVNAILYSNGFNEEGLCVYSNMTRLFDVYWAKVNNNNEIINTEFKTLSNTFSKNETITYAPRAFGTCGNYDVLQTYILTNTRITSEFYNQSLYNLSHYDSSEYLFRITPQDRTIITGLTVLWGYDGYSDYIAYKLNSTTYRSNELLCIIGINYDRVNYVQFNDLTMGMVFQGNNSNNYFFNLHTSTILPEIARISLNIIKENIGKTAQTLLLNLDNNSSVFLYTNNISHIFKLYSNNLNNVYLIMNTTSGILASIILLNDFIYNGAISDPLIEEINEVNMMFKASTMTCWEDNCRYNAFNKSTTVLGWSTNSSWAKAENMLQQLQLLLEQEF